MQTEQPSTNTRLLSSRPLKSKYRLFFPPLPVLHPAAPLSLCIPQGTRFAEGSSGVREMSVSLRKPLAGDGEPSEGRRARGEAGCVREARAAAEGCAMGWTQARARQEVSSHQVKPELGHKPKESYVRVLSILPASRWGPSSCRNVFPSLGSKPKFKIQGGNV